MLINKIETRLRTHLSLGRLPYVLEILAFKHSTDEITAEASCPVRMRDDGSPPTHVSATPEEVHVSVALVTVLGLVALATSKMQAARL